MQSSCTRSTTAIQQQQGSCVSSSYHRRDIEQRAMSGAYLFLSVIGSCATPRSGSAALPSRSCNTTIGQDRRDTRARARTHSVTYRFSSRNQVVVFGRNSGHESKPGTRRLGTLCSMSSCTKSITAIQQQQGSCVSSSYRRRDVEQ